MIERLFERVVAGLPEASVGIPDRIMIPHKNGKLERSDVEHNLYAHIASASRVQLEPPLCTREELLRSLVIRAIVDQSVTEALGPAEAQHPWQS